MSIGIVIGLVVLFAIDPGGGPGPTDASNDSDEAAIETPAVPTNGSREAASDSKPVQTTGDSSVQGGSSTVESLQDSSSVKDSAVVSVTETGGESSPQAPPPESSTKEGEGFGLSNSVEFIVRDADGNIKGQGSSK